MLWPCIAICSNSSSSEVAKACPCSTSQRPQLVDTTWALSASAMTLYSSYSPPGLGAS